MMFFGLEQRLETTALRRARICSKSFAHPRRSYFARSRRLCSVVYSNSAAAHRLISDTFQTKKGTTNRLGVLKSCSRNTKKIKPIEPIKTSDSRSVIRAGERSHVHDRIPRLDRVLHVRDCVAVIPLDGHDRLRIKHFSDQRSVLLLIANKQRCANSR